MGGGDDSTVEEGTGSATSGEEMAFKEGQTEGSDSLPPDIESDGPDIETLQFMCADAQRVVDHQVDNLRDIDDKALRTVRITMVVIGLLLAGGQFDISQRAFNTYTISGGVLLFVSITFGVLTYSASDPYFGPGPTYIDDVLETTNGERGERIESLKSYADWMGENDTLIQRSGLYLLIAQITLIAGLAGIGVGVTAAVLESDTLISMIMSVSEVNTLVNSL